MSVADTQAQGQRTEFGALGLHHGGIQHGCSLLGQRARGVHRTPALGMAVGRNFGAAFQAGSEQGGFCQGRGVEEPAMKALRCSHPADGTAVNASGGHAYKHLTVETRIFGDEGAVAGVGVEVHGPDYG